MKCTCGNPLTFIRNYDEIIDDKAIVHNEYYCNKCKAIIKTEMVGEVNFWYPEEIVRAETKNGLQIKL